MKRVLVTGAGGFVGARILDMWRGQFALCAFPSDTLRTADENAVLRFILKEHPDVIVHTAALSNTQYCQQEPEDSFRANVASVWSILNLVLMFNDYSKGLYNAQFLQLLALGVIPLVFAIWLGNKIHDMINQKMFNRLTYCLLLAAGSIILI